jgi:hypothetical protein
MREPPCRPFSLLDAMILVAAVAVGFGGTRMLGWGVTPDSGPASPLYWSLAHGSIDIAVACLPSLMALTLTFFVIRLRGPRPSLRRVARQPGTVACCAVVLTMTVYVGQILMMALSFGRIAGVVEPVADFVKNHARAEIWTIHAGFAIAGAWLAQVLLGRWSPRACWIDRFGRALGVAWIVFGLVCLGADLAWFILINRDRPRAIG